MKLKPRTLQIISWLVAGLAALVAVLVWLDGLHWSFERLSAYRLFPLFGLLAFGLMWSHYIVAGLRLFFDLDKSVTRKFKTTTGWIVLAAIVLHPSILIFKLWQDDFGLPPESYLEHYVRPGLEWAALLGTFSLLIFLAYESYRWFETKKWWRYIQGASDVAMLLILVHGFRLGSHIQTGWFRGVWIFYSFTLITALVFIYEQKFSKSKNMLG